MDLDSNQVRRAGFLWLLSTVTGGFGMFYERSHIIAWEDASATASHLLALESLFRVAVVSSLLSQLFLLFLGLSLYSLFKEAGRKLALVLLASVLLTVALAVANTLTSFAALAIVTHHEYLKVFDARQLNALALFFFRLGNSSGQGLVELFWIPYYFAFGLLVIRSRAFPKVLGFLLLLMSAGFALNLLDKFLVPSFYPAFFTQLAMILGAVGGIPTILWFMIMGAKPQLPEVPAQTRVRLSR